MNKKQKLIKYIQGEIPEIMEVDYNLFALEESVINLAQDISKIENSVTGAMFEISRQELQNKINSRKEIGRPITLSDVLRVIKSEKIMIGENGFFWEYRNSQPFAFEKKEQWNLEENFNGQSQEFYNWLYQLLIENK